MEEVNENQWKSMGNSARSWKSIEDCLKFYGSL